ncbi:MAG: phosphoribosylformylglycinamidine cyclo-ligase [Planctomycetota bacterium]|nr:phosphoribosylformylglycinamidine cyclo-ligase [Planctomycetota bacterium]
MSSAKKSPITYQDSGVDTEQGAHALSGLLSWVRSTESFRAGTTGQTLCPSGHFATILDLGGETALAAASDGVGTKLLIAQMLDRYDTVGIDCVAMNVNDLVCVGADPIAMLDYLAIAKADPKMLEAIGQGLHEGARLANISIPGGELAQIPSMLSGYHPDRAFDLVGTAFGLVPRDQILTGDQLEPGQIIVGLESNGLHSNGYSLARRVLLEHAQLPLKDPHPDLDSPLAEELLRPTAIYVEFCRRLTRRKIFPTWLCHITGDGLLNLLRCQSTVKFVIDNHPSPPPIFRLIQRLGPVDTVEMFRTFNMGLGFCVVIPESDLSATLEEARACGHQAQQIGHLEASSIQEVLIPEFDLVGSEGSFRRISRD